MENVITNNSFLRLALEEIIIFTSAELKEKKIAIIDIDINDTYGVNLSSIKSADKCIILCAKKVFLLLRLFTECINGNVFWVDKNDSIDKIKYRLSSLIHSRLSDNTSIRLATYLTSMESKILYFTMHGMTNIQSAKILKTGAKIISSHKRNIMIKVGAKSKQELYYLAKPIYTGGLFK